MSDNKKSIFYKSFSKFEQLFCNYHLARKKSAMIYTVSGGNETHVNMANEG